jgi:nucleotide-binding universal stress UspA family protein
MGLGSKVLVATDLSEGADEAIRQGHAHARAAQGELIACTVVPNSLRNNPLFPQRAEPEALELLDAERRAAQMVAERVADLTGRTFQAEGTPGGPNTFRVIVENGSPEAGIVHRADGEKATLIAVGSTGATGLDRLLLGSTAERVVRYAPCPVLVARAHAATGRILAATDFSDPALPAVSAAADEARARNARITLLYSIDVMPSPSIGWGAPFGASWVVPPPELIHEARAGAESALKDILKRLQIEGDVLATEGDAASAILRAARELPAELVVLATRGRTGLARMVLGSVAEKVIEVAPCSVLAVRLA